MFETPSQLIETLKRNPDVLGILQYGSGMSPEAADTDICVVVRTRPPGLESIHFWLECGPVDMNLRTPEELRGEGNVAPLSGFEDVLRERKVLWEREPGLLKNVSVPTRGESAPIDAAAATQMRFGHAHYMQKIEHYRDRDPSLCRTLLSGAVHWLLRSYAQARGLEYRGEKAILKAMREEGENLVRDLELAAGECPLPQRIEALRRLTEKALEPIGGPWTGTSNPAVPIRPPRALDNKR